MAKKEDDAERSSQVIIRAARRFSGESADDEMPLSAEEERIMDEVLAQPPRPTQEEINDMARRLVARPTRPT